MFKFTPPTFVFTLLNLIVLVWFLKRLLFKPITDLLDKRAKDLKNSFDEAGRVKHEAEEMKAIYTKWVNSAKDESERIIREARNSAAKKREELLKMAKQEAEVYIEHAKREIDQERHRMLRDLKGQIADLVVAAASKVIQDNMDTASNRAIVNEFIKEVDVA